MKKIILLAALVAFGVTTANAQTAKKVATKPAAKVETPKVDGPGMLFENETIDYGTVPANSDGKREFVFVNNGTKPLMIESAQGSCGCTVPTTPKEAIAPGAKGIIGVKYDTSRAGQPFTKTVTVKSNAVGQETKVLTIKGNVLPAETKVEPTKS
ncbi:MAG: DUF1573 domain-containing protein [Flavobacterium sp.]|jgi:Protein of unknown function (DUF1573)|nr:DUF1573 domain-containing protein [Flavobacterium sp.]